MSDKKYNHTVLDIYGLGKVEGEVGIEIEIEGNNLVKGPIGEHWNYHPDHSLRGADNAEYVIRRPIHRKNVSPALTELFTILKGAKATFRKDSPNTSVHVHLNVQEWSIKQVYSFICLWYILEHTLMDWCGEGRVGNLFCLRGSDAEYALQRLASAVRYSRYGDLNDQDGLRYLSLNYTALGKFGSLEFRGLAGVYDPDVINTWIKMLLRLKDFAEKFQTPPDIIMEYSRSGPEEFLKLALGDLSGHVMTPQYKDQLKFGMRLIQNVAYCVNWDREPVSKKKVAENDRNQDQDQPQEGFDEPGNPAGVHGDNNLRIREIYNTNVRHHTNEDNQRWAVNIERQGLVRYITYNPINNRWMPHEGRRPEWLRLEEQPQEIRPMPAGRINLNNLVAPAAPAGQWILN